MTNNKLNRQSGNKWDVVITPRHHLLELNLGEIWEFRDLLLMFIKRDIVTVYKQTIFGPIWYLAQPVLTMVVFIVVFTNIANISTDSIPPSLFYLAGIVMWNYFSDCFNQTSDTFFQNAYLFNKVYFPRIILPLSKVISSLIKFFIQASLFLVVYIYFILKGGNLSPSYAVLLIPVYLVLMGGIGLGTGIIFTSITTKYRDLKFIISTFIQLFMYATPVIYPMSILTPPYSSLMFFNPVAHIIEGFKFAFFGTGELNISGLLYSAGFTLIILISGIVIFNKTERNFVDFI